MQPEMKGKSMRAELLEESIRMELAKQAERFGVKYGELSANVQSWLRSLVIEQLYRKDAAPAVSPEVEDDEETP
jgi:hypothetical protein